MSNPQSEPLFDATAFDRYQWTKILDNVLPKECQYFSQEFKREAEAYQSSGDIVAYEVFNFLSQITSTILRDTLLGSESQKSSKSKINNQFDFNNLGIVCAFSRCNT